MSGVYEPFAGFEPWQGVRIDADRWQAVLDRVEELREEEAGFGWLQGPLRAAAYQSGAIEGLHPGDRGLTLTLMNAVSEWEAAVRAAPDGGGPEVVDYISAGVEALEMALDVAIRTRPITQAWIRELHAVACGPQDTYMAMDSLGNRAPRPLPKGAYKEHDNTVTLPSGDLLVYAPPLDVPAEMERLVHEIGSERFSVAHPVVQSAFAQHALTHVHPFPDGNGRVARALGSVYLLRAASLPFFLFADGRNRYLDALAAADQGDVGVFVAFVLERFEDLSAILVEQRRAAKPLASDGSTLETWGRRLDEARDQAAAFGRAVDRGVDQVEQRHRIRKSTPGLATAFQSMILGARPGDFPEGPLLEREVSVELGGYRETETLTAEVDLNSSGGQPFVLRANRSGLKLRARPDEVWPTPTAAFELRLDAWLDQVVRALAERVNPKLWSGS